MTVKFEGGKELEKALMELKNTTAKATVRRAGKKALIPLRDKAIALAPYNSASGADGHVKDEIHISTKAAKGTRKKSQVEVYCGVATSQGHVGSLQEFGTAHHGPQPFMRPAWDGLKMTVLTRFRDEMWTEVRKSAERQRRKAKKQFGGNP